MLRIVLLALIGLIFWIPSSAQTICLGVNCEANQGTDPYADMIIDYASTELSSDGLAPSPEKKQCYAVCKSRFLSSMSACNSVFNSLMNGSSEGLRVCREVARDNLNECIGLTGYGLCNKRHPE